MRVIGKCEHCGGKKLSFIKCNENTRQCHEVIMCWQCKETFKTEEDLAWERDK